MSVARKARERGLTSAPWVKPSLAPGTKVVTRYLAESGRDKDLEEVGRLMQDGRSVLLDAVRPEET